jgi:mRNA interferase HicA
MKRVDLVRVIEQMGCELVRHGGKHDWYRNPATGVLQAVPRHREIKEHLARRIIRSLTAPVDEPPGEEQVE